MDISKQIKMSLGLEDDAPQVEINFNVDTDDNGAPLSPVDQDGDESVEAAENEAIEAEAEANKAETEQEELEEAQEALESLKLVLDKAALTGGLSPIAMEMFKVAMTRVTGSKALVEQVTMESALASPVQRQLEAAKLVEVSLESLETVSMEGIKEKFAKLKDALGKFFNTEKSMIKRAKALMELAETREGEHATSKTIPVNVKRGLKSKQLTRVEFKSSKEILAHLEKMYKLFDSIKVPSVDNVKRERMSDDLFALSPSDWEKNKGSDGVYYFYTYFGIKVKRTDKLDVDYDDSNKSIDSLPVATIDETKKMLSIVVKMLETSGVIKQIMGELDDLQYSELQEHGDGEVFSQLDYNISAISQLVFHRDKLFKELIDYCGMCIQDRGVDSPTSDE